MRRRRNTIGLIKLLSRIGSNGRPFSPVVVSFLVAAVLLFAFDLPPIFKLDRKLFWLENPVLQDALCFMFVGKASDAQIRGSRHSFVLPLSRGYQELCASNARQ